MTERLLTVDEVAERLSIGPETVRRLLRTGRLRGSQPISKRAGWRVAVEDLERFERGEAALGPAPRQVTPANGAGRGLDFAVAQMEQCRERGDQDGAAYWERIAGGIAAASESPS